LIELLTAGIRIFAHPWGLERFGSYKIDHFGSEFAGITWIVQRQFDSHFPGTELAGHFEWSALRNLCLQER
jgi:hypothetical protein